MINYIVKNVDSQFTVYSDLPGHLAPGGSSILPEIFVTAEKQDIVILNNHKKEMYLFELSCPSEHNIENRHLDKCKKNAHFLRDCPDYKCTNS